MRRRAFVTHLRVYGEHLFGARQEVGEFLVGRLGEDGRGPHVRGEERVGPGDGLEKRPGEVTLGRGLADSVGVAVVDTSHGQELLRDRGADNAGTTRGRDETDGDRTALARELGRNGVRLGALGAEAEVPVVVADSNERAEPGALTGLGLLLDWGDLDNLVLEAGGRPC